MVVLITGSRSGFTQQDFDVGIQSVVDISKVSVMISGGASGVDSLAREYSERNGIEFIEMKADWGSNGMKAGVVRNIEMAEALCKYRDEGRDVCVFALRFDHSSGTTHMIKHSVGLGLDVYCIDKLSVDFN